MQNNDIDFGRRVRELRKALNLTQSEFGNKVGLMPNTVTNYETGRRGASNQIVISICREWNVNETWLREGTGSMFIELSQSERAAQAVGKLLRNDSEFVQKTMIALGSLSADEWKAVESWVTKNFGSDT